MAGEIRNQLYNKMYHNNAKNSMCNAMKETIQKERSNLNDNDRIRIVHSHLATSEKILGSFTSYIATIDLNNLIQWF